jgi:phage/plasmid primase-like uncharacterized protein
MVAAVQTRAGIVAVHRTYLQSDGGDKAALVPNNALLGSAVGAAIRLAEAQETLALAEGLETALSIAQACPYLAVWCAISASFLPRIEIPELVQTIIICADADEPGAKGARSAVARFSRLGLKSRIAVPARMGADFNDELKA